MKMTRILMSKDKIRPNRNGDHLHIIDTKNTNMHPFNKVTSFITLSLQFMYNGHWLASLCTVHTPENLPSWIMSEKGDNIYRRSRKKLAHVHLRSGD